MKYIILFILLSIFLLSIQVSIESAAKPNLVKNSGFEEGDKYPKYWDRQDDLTSFWEKDEERGGKCIRCYTRIDNDEYHARVAEMKQANPPPPKKPREIKGEGYETVGGIDGVSYYCEWIDVKPAMTYTLTADVRSEGGKPMIFVKGYSEMPVEIDDKGQTKTVLMKRVTYKIYLDCAGSKKWKSNTIDFCPTLDREDVKWMRVMLYAYWPPQNYWFDNIAITENGVDSSVPKRWAAKKEKAQKEAADDKAALIEEARNSLDYIRKAIERYKADIGEYPPTLDALEKNNGNPNWTGPYLLEVGPDPWGNSYQYKRTDKGYSLKSFGPDGKEGGGDDVE